MTAASMPKESSAYPVVETAYGKGPRSCCNGVSSFKGIPYGASTAGRNRFMPPVAPATWASVRDALSYGPTAPQNPSSMRGLVDPKSGFAAYGDPDGIIESEDCLVLNVWTSDASENRQRPVIVWLHGAASRRARAHRRSTTEAISCGAVTWSSSVSIIGWARWVHVFAGIGGDDFSSARNVGNLDLIAALEWVRDNIAKSAAIADGNESSVSRVAGRKSRRCSQCRQAKNLFHRAVVQSGPDSG